MKYRWLMIVTAISLMLVWMPAFLGAVFPSPDEIKSSGIPVNMEWAEAISKPAQHLASELRGLGIMLSFVFVPTLLLLSFGNIAVKDRMASIPAPVGKSKTTKAAKPRELSHDEWWGLLLKNDAEQFEKKARQQAAEEMHQQGVIDMQPEESPDWKS